MLLFWTFTLPLLLWQYFLKKFTLQVKRAFIVLIFGGTSGHHFHVDEFLYLKGWPDLGCWLLFLFLFLDWNGFHLCIFSPQTVLVLLVRFRPFINFVGVLLGLWENLDLPVDQLLLYFGVLIRFYLGGLAVVVALRVQVPLTHFQLLLRSICVVVLHDLFISRVSYLVSWVLFIDFWFNNFLRPYFLKWFYFFLGLLSF